MTVYLAWVSAPPQEEPVGPWRELRWAAAGLALVDSNDSLSAVYHALKWSLPDDAALLVAPVAATPKLRGVSPGTLSWLRQRT